MAKAIIEGLVFMAFWLVVVAWLWVAQGVMP